MDIVTFLATWAISTIVISAYGFWCYNLGLKKDKEAMTEEEVYIKDRTKDALEDLGHIITVDNDSATRQYLEKYHTTIELALKNVLA